MADLDNLKGNSFKEREAAEEKKEETVNKSVVKGETKIRKKTELEKVADTFLAEDRAKAWEHIINDLLVPAVNNFIVDTIAVLLKVKITPDQNRSRTIDSVSYRSYDKQYDRRREPVQAPRSANSFGDVILSYRDDAEAVLDRMADAITCQGYASIANLYEFSGQSDCIRYTYYDYGWTDIRDARVDMLPNGDWIIRMPPAVYIGNLKKRR